MDYRKEYIQLSLKNMVCESLCVTHGIKREDADVLIRNSSFLQLLKEDPEFIGHYPPEYWADYIIEEREIL